MTEGSDTAATPVRRTVDEPALTALATRMARLAVAGDVIALHGPLGAGKSTFARQFIRSFGSAHGNAVDDVPSPTFTLVQTYALGDDVIWHFDLYRIGAADELWELGLEEALGGICLIEWPEKALAFLPADRLDLYLDHTGNDLERQLMLVGEGAVGRRLLGALDAPGESTP